MFLLIIFLLVVALELVTKILINRNKKSIIAYENEQPPIQKESQIANELQTLRQDIQKMKQDAAILNTSETFAKYSKIQRQLIPKEEQLINLENQYKSEQEQFIQEWKQQRVNQPKPISYQKYIQYVNKFVFAIILIITWNQYSQINNIEQKQFGWFLGQIIGKQNDDGIFEIWIPFWLIASNIVSKSFI